MPRLSIVVPVYKAEQYISSCVDSILQQKYRDFELILVDDGSPDRCPDICDLYAEKDFRIKVLHQKNSGSIAARNVGLLAASGEYVAYIDADDWVDEDMYSVLMAEAKLEDADVIACGYCEERVSGSKKRQHCLPSGRYQGNKMQDIYDKALYFGGFYEFGIVPALWNKVIRRKILLKNQLNVHKDIRMGEDVAIIFPVLAASSCVVIKNEFYPYHYRIVSDSMSRSYDKQYFLRIEKLLQGLKNNPDIRSRKVMWKSVDYYALFLIEIGLTQIFNKRENIGCRKIKNVLKEVVEDFDVGNIIKRIDLEKFPAVQKRNWEYLAQGRYDFYILRRYLGKFVHKVKNRITGGMS